MVGVYKRTWRGEDGKERVRWIAAYRDQDGRRHNKGFVTRKDAKTFLTLVEGEIVRGIHTPEHASITAAKAVDLWLTRGELERLERSTLRQYRNHVRLHIVPLIGSVKLAKLSTPVVQLFSRQAARDPLAGDLAQDIGQPQVDHRRGDAAPACCPELCGPGRDRQQEARSGQAPGQP